MDTPQDESISSAEQLAREFELWQKQYYDEVDALFARGDQIRGNLAFDLWNQRFFIFLKQSAPLLVSIYQKTVLTENIVLVREKSIHQRWKNYKGQRVEDFLTEAINNARLGRLTSEPISSKSVSSSTKQSVVRGGETMYNLTAKQKEILQWIVKNVREGNLEEEFTFARSINDDIMFIAGEPGDVTKPVPDLSSGALRALTKAGLMLTNPDQGGVQCTLLGQAYQAVDSNFNDVAKKQEILMTNSVFGAPNPKYSYDIFVLMPFAQELKPIYDSHIRKTVKALNLSIARADNFFSQNAIMDEIWSAIACATILIADCTNKNPNVFYEIGLAHAIGKPVIIITQNPEDVPFDLRHRRYIQYAYTPPGMEKFEKDLSATISETLKDLEVSK